MANKLVTVEQAARAARVPVAEVMKWIADGRLEWAALLSPLRCETERVSNPHGPMLNAPQRYYRLSDVIACAQAAVLPPDWGADELPAAEAV